MTSKLIVSNTQSKPEISPNTAKNNYAHQVASEEQTTIASSIAKDKTESTISSSHSWEGIMASEMGIDPDLMKAQKIHKKIHLSKGLLKDLKKAHPTDSRKQAGYLEEVLASHHMKDLTNKYGSMGKSSKQHFMEAYDNDIKMETNFEEEGVHHYDSKGREIQPHNKKHEANTEKSEIGRRKHKNNLPCSPIVFKSLEDINLEGNEDKDKSFKTLEISEENFWASLERLQNQVEDDISESNLSWCPPSIVGGSATTLFEDISRKKLAEDLVKERDTLSSSYDQGKFIMKEATLDKYVEPVQEVVQSAAVKQAWEIVRQHLEQFDCKDPLAYDMFGKTYDEARDFVKLPDEDVEEFEAGNWEPIPQEDEKIFTMEPPEKLLGRYGVYEKALLYMMEHFKVLRPLLSQIRQSYMEVMERCDREWRDLDKLRLDQVVLKDAFAAHVRAKDKEGDKMLMEVKLQTHALQEHIQWQQHTLQTILTVLWKMRQSLRMQSKLVQKTSVNYKNKVEILAKEIVNQQGSTMFEMALPGKYHEMMQKFRNIKDPHEVRRLLQFARRQLKKARKRIFHLEYDYVDTIPIEEMNIFVEQFEQIHSANLEVIKKCDQIKSRIRKIKDSIEEKYQAMVKLLLPPSPNELESKSLENLEGEDENGEGDGEEE